MVAGCEILGGWVASSPTHRCAVAQRVFWSGRVISLSCHAWTLVCVPVRLLAAFARTSVCGLVLWTALLKCPSWGKEKMRLFWKGFFLSLLLTGWSFVWSVWWRAPSWGPSLLLLEKTHHVAMHQDLLHQAYRGRGGGEGNLSNSKLWSKDRKPAFWCIKQ